MSAAPSPSSSAQPDRPALPDYTLGDDRSITDSGFGRSTASGCGQSSLENLADSFVYENGRRYHVYHAGSYFLPNDEMELARLRLFHNIFYILLGGRLYIAPLENPKKILDVGTGGGEWADSMALLYPDSQVIGVDLSPVPNSWMMQPNCTFEIDDIENEWLWPKEYFDFIHARCMTGCFSDWDTFWDRCMVHLKPGGYVEFQDFNGELLTASLDRTRLGHEKIPASKDGALSRWWSLVLESSNRIGRSFSAAGTMDERLIKAGFVDINVNLRPIVLTAWPENSKLDFLGKAGREGMCEGLIAVSIALLTRHLGWSYKDVTELCMNAKKDLMHEDSRYWCQMSFISAKKPLE